MTHALRAWREGENVLAHPALEEDRSCYERAVAAFLGALPPTDSVAALARYYILRRSAVDALAQETCRAQAPDRDLLIGAVADAAFWRRFRAMVGEAVGTP
jgi:hypothetical protein